MLVRLSQGPDHIGAGIRKPYLRVVGVHVDTEGPGRSTGAPLNMAEEEEFRRFATRADAYETIAKSIAPSIYGSEEIKKCISCLLFGGSRKRWTMKLCPNTSKQVQLLHYLLSHYTRYKLLVFLQRSIS